MIIDRVLPYYKWFWQDWRANRKIQRMTYIEKGLYRELLDECWVEGFIPDDIEELADICGCPKEIMANAPPPSPPKVPSPEEPPPEPSV